MKLEHTFTVPVGVEQAWRVLLDIERVAPCMPGAVLDSVDGDSFTGRVKIKLGPVNLTYKGAASFIEKDPAAHRVVLDANGKDARGNGTAAAKVTATLVEEGESTRVDVVTDLNITGKPAQFGRGVMVDVGNKLIGQFASCLEGKINAGPEPAVAPAGDAPGPDTVEQQAVPVEDDRAAPPESARAGAPPAPGPAPAPPAPADSAAPPAPREVHPPSTDPEPIDLLELAGGSVITRVAPLLGALVVLTLVFVVLRRRRR